jgi:hypothetical protein
MSPYIKEDPMLTKRLLIPSAMCLVVFAIAPAHAGFRLGIGLTFPIGGPCYYGYPYYYPAVYPAPVVVGSPVVYQPAYAVPTAPAPVPVSAAQPAPVPVAAPALTPTPRSPVTQTAGRDDEVEACLQNLAGGADGARAAAAVQLGRLHAGRAVPALERALSEDRSPAVREAAARGLGLIGDSSALDALQRAAQGDDDREVRHSASFAADVIRSNFSRR